MTDTTSPAPSMVARAATAVAEQTSAGWTFLMGLLPSINFALTAIVSLVLGVGGTLATQKIAAPAPKAEAVIPVAPMSSEVIHLLTTIKGDVGLIADWVAVQQKNVPARPAVGLPAAKAAPVKAGK